MPTHQFHILELLSSWQELVFSWPLLWTGVIREVELLMVILNIIMTVIIYCFPRSLQWSTRSTEKAINLILFTWSCPFIRCWSAGRTSLTITSLLQLKLCSHAHQRQWWCSGGAQMWVLKKVMQKLKKDILNVFNVLLLPVLLWAYYTDKDNSNQISSLGHQNKNHKTIWTGLNKLDLLNFHTSAFCKKQTCLDDNLTESNQASRSLEYILLSVPRLSGHSLYNSQTWKPYFPAVASRYLLHGYRIAKIL